MTKAAAKKRTPAASRGGFSALLAWTCLILLGFVVLGALTLWSYTFFLVNQHDIDRRFAGNPWKLPARVYARPLELFQGASVNAAQLRSELELLRYRNVSTVRTPGSFNVSDQYIDIHSRRFAFWDGVDEGRFLRVRFAEERVAALESLDGEAAPGLWRLEPSRIAGIYPDHHEDRLVIQRNALPPVLVDALLAIEDRAFYQHFGINPRGIARAIMTNMRQGRLVQGGSTLTQQLVKNFFLSSERTYRRKLEEMLIAIYIDWRYNKDEILTAYANEIYLGQDGSRAIHGFALASRFYFDRTLEELGVHHVALLVGMVQGPGQYNPRRNPERAKARRNLVLDVMAEQRLISPEAAQMAKAKPLEVSDSPPRGKTRYPAFVDLVERQLRQIYRDEDLKSEGLKVFTSLDPHVQEMAEAAMTSELPQLERNARLDEGLLQTASIVVNTQNGEVLAMVGGRDPRIEGFNRALDALRQPGSLLKPAIYLSALEHSERYTLATMLDDSRPIVYNAGGRRWAPANYDRKLHGYIMLQDALARSLNIPTVRIGLDIDVLNIIKTLNRLGLSRDLEPYPSLLLGAIDITLFEVAQYYETFASGGFRVGLRAITEVTGADGTPLPRSYQLAYEKAVEPGPAYLLTRALQRVVTHGTARSIHNRLPESLGLAGKTGTTDDYRDSWFAGYSGNLLAVVWVGRDDNKPMRLSGSRGALPLWIEIMSRLELEPLNPVKPPEVKEWTVDVGSGLLASRECGGGRSVSFIEGSQPRRYATCGGSSTETQPLELIGRSQREPLAPPPPPPPPPAQEESSDPISNFFRSLIQ